MQIGTKDTCEAKQSELDTEDEESVALKQDGKENVAPKQDRKENAAPKQDGKENLASKQEGKDNVPKKRRRKRIPKVCGIRNNNSTLLMFCRMMKSQKLKGQVDLGRKKRYCCLLL